MKNWKDALIAPSLSILETIKVIDKAALGIALVVKGEILIGVVTDGDIRRAIVNGIDLNESITLIMNKNPITLSSESSESERFSVLRKHSIYHLPIVDKSNHITTLISIDGEILGKEVDSTPIIIMVGGLGSRLKGLTENCPKPLLKVGDKPLLESTILNLKRQGFQKFVLSVNYLSEKITEYFQDGNKLGVEISYIHEKKRLGTAGALKLNKFDQNIPVVVMNGDILTKVDLAKVLSFHRENKNDATMCVRNYEVKVPYGVVNVDEDEKISSIVEKPTKNFFINAGIYIINSNLFKLIPCEEYFDMTNFFDVLVANKKNCKVYPVYEYWMDIGNLEDYKKANSDFNYFFKI